MTCEARLAEFFNIDINDNTTSDINEKICDEAFERINELVEIIQGLETFINKLSDDKDSRELVKDASKE